jgi:aldehyde dehydrogenase
VPFTEVPRSSAEDIELALDAAHIAKEEWAETSTTQRSKVLNKIADAIEENLEMLAVAESWENSKPVRETPAADIPLAADHFRYFASVIRAEEGGISELDTDTVAYHFHEPLGRRRPSRPGTASCSSRRARPLGRSSSSPS